MEIRLGESIRRLRKESGFTQEQLAEALGVSVSAVHKWESGKATPELEMLVDIAEFFETSVDAMLNYGWEKLNMGQTAKQIRTYTDTRKFEEGMRFAERALQKYPNSFDVRSWQKLECCVVMNLVQKSGCGKRSGRPSDSTLIPNTEPPMV